jgi:hypothetical protein
MHSKNLKNSMHCEVMINQVPSVFRFSLIQTHTVKQAWSLQEII